jgi:glycosyltransferase involved in cell wall biosynthesis
MLSVVVPAHNEAASLEALVDEVRVALDAAGVEHELVLVDDGSTDATAAVLARLAATTPRLRVVTLPPRLGGRGHGQSAALCAGIGAARGGVVAMMDADLQNDPADIPRLLELLRARRLDLVQGARSPRADGAARRLASALARVARRVILGDRVRDAGCTLRLLPRPVAAALPLARRGMHRFIPALVRGMGGTVAEARVRHRPRRNGRSRYPVWGRMLPGALDCLAVRRMIRCGELRRPDARDASAPASRDGFAADEPGPR